MYWLKCLQAIFNLLKCTNKESRALRATFYNMAINSSIASRFERTLIMWGWPE